MSTDPADREARACFDFFWNEANPDPASPGFGLVRDRDAPSSACSIASVGFAFAALAIGAERGWVERPAAEARAAGALDTLLERSPVEHGFLYHFLDMASAGRYRRSEASVIDTALCVAGAMAAGEYFGGRVRDLAERLYRRVEWPWYRDPASDRFRMGWWPERGFDGSWKGSDEQLLMYVLGAGSPAHPVPGTMWYAVERPRGSWAGGPPFVHSSTGSLFTHQFSHAFVDFRGTVDRDGIDWHANSTAATLSNRRYCIDDPEGFRTFGPDSWGLTACDGPRGYCGSYGAPPAGDGTRRPFANDGTVPPCGALGSFMFTPDESAAALAHYAGVPGLQGRYGLRDAYNLDVDPPWYGRDVIGIDKGITLLAIENHRTGLAWDLVSRNPWVRAGLERCGVRRGARGGPS